MSEYGEQVSTLPSKNGKIDFREGHSCCTDWWCLIVFVACVIATIVIFGVSWRDGDVQGLLYPVNKDSQFCGIKSNNSKVDYDNTKTPYLYRPVIWNATEEYCVAECPTENVSCFYPSTGLFDDTPMGACELQGGNTTYPTIELVYRCIPDPRELKDALKDFEDYETFQNVFITSVSDFKTGWWLLFVAGGGSLILSFVWTCVFQCCGFCLVWTCIIVALVAIFVVGGWLLYYGLTGYSEAVLDQDLKSYYVAIGFGGAILLVGLILLLIVIALRKRISLAVALIAEAGKAMRAMWCTLVVPVVYILFFFATTACLIVTGVLYFSSLTRELHENSYHFVWTSNTRYIMVFMLLMFFWITFFLIGMNQATLAGAGAEWYFVHDKSDTPMFPVARSLRILILNHLGSIAVGSFLIAVVCTIRAVLLYLSKKVKGSQNEALKYLLACLQCCLGCLQKILEFIAARAYIMMMIKGRNFFVSAYDALKLMLRNFLRTAILTGITKIVLLLGVLGVSVLSTLICLLIMRPDFVGITVYNLRIYYWWLLTFVCFVVAVCVAYLIMQVYDFLIDTIFLCFLIDEEMAQTNQGDYYPYASSDLKEYMEDIKTKSEQHTGQSTNEKQMVNVAV